ncbi:DUF1254 domain-containing protein [Alterisphingorhabdus coralli]|uniref:DUF1254 domain-containing protein n=1 Tax=Alterisphingorhabdus coralli TaxID=3071408 RepID=A0AA97FAS5_9SPHN|nr:DUF1254 domain-containing protein [Parasphingorhabdus sp. SCSIO 66989]WOE76432.1 DUF1254 domain-containing protein [Parasphingorhabdus sp. SCSIO 66989]
MRPQSIVFGVMLLLASGIGGYFGVFSQAPSYIMGRAWDSITERVGEPNVMSHVPLVDASSRDVVRPSPDLLYSICPFDLHKAPLRVHAEAVPDHYWSLTVFDEETNAVYVRSDRDTGGESIDVVVGRFDQLVNKTGEKVQVPGNKGIALVRVLMKDRSEFDAIDPIRSKSTCEPIVLR